MKYFRCNHADTSQSAAEPASAPKTDRADELLRLKRSRNRANTIRNWSKVEDYLMRVEKANGFARSWVLRERLEQGQVSLDELMRG